MKEFIVQTDMDLNGVVEFEGAGGVSFKPHGELIRCRNCKHWDRGRCRMSSVWTCTDKGRLLQLRSEKRLNLSRTSQNYAE